MKMEYEDKREICFKLNIFDLVCRREEKKKINWYKMIKKVRSGFHKKPFIYLKIIDGLLLYYLEKDFEEFQKKRIKNENGNK